MKHPARTMPFRDLLKGLTLEVARGNVAVTTCYDTGLKLYTYTNECVYNKAWNKYSLLARGLILDLKKMEVVATPFPKFFNVSEAQGQQLDIPALPFETFEKIDGSLIILFWYDGEWRTATKGSFTSDQAVWANKFLTSFDKSRLDGTITYLCEAVYRENRIVVQYSKEALFLLAAYRQTGDEVPYEQLQNMAKGLGWPLARREEVASIADLLGRAKTLSINEEGWVVRFTNGLRMKIKGDEYLRIHRLVSQLTPLGVWASMWKGDDLHAARKELPEEFWGDFDSIKNLLQEKIDEIVWKSAYHYAQVAYLSDKDIGLKLHEFPADIRSFIFPLRKNKGNLMAGKTRDTVFRAIRPTGNRLEGYVPSSAIGRIEHQS